jgi:hypothetical protein
MGVERAVKKKECLLVGMLAILGACTMPNDEFDYVESSPVTVTASPLDAKVGKAVEVTLTGSLELDKRSRVSERPISDITIGVCFGHGLTANGEGIVDPHGFCSKEVEALPDSYEMLNGTEYTKKFDDVVIRRGERREYKHTFTFTLTEANELVLEPHMMFRDEFYTGPSFRGNIPQNYPTVTFE